MAKKKSQAEIEAALLLQELSDKYPQKGRLNFFLDSGAFSAFTQNETIEVDDYIEFIRRNNDLISMYANLDVIGSAEGTHANQKYMEEQGMSPLPVYHAGEPFEYLEEMVENYDYICLGGAAGRLRTTEALKQWLDVIWGKYLTDEKGYPRVKVHGFGITSFRLLLRYPWESADSTSWVRAAAYGSILVPRAGKDGKPTYQKPPYVITISSKSPSATQAGKHYDTFSEAAQKYVRDYVETHDISIEQCRSHYTHRCRLNIMYYNEFAANKIRRPFIRKNAGFFHE